MSASGISYLLQTFSPSNLSDEKIYQDFGQRRFQQQIYFTGIEHITKQIIGYFFHINVWFLLSCLSRKIKIALQEQNLFHTYGYTFMHDYISS